MTPRNAATPDRVAEGDEQGSTKQHSYNWNDSERVATAYHEAGHAAARFDQALTTPYVTIEVDGDVLGKTAGTDALINGYVAALVTAAGPAAEALHRMWTAGDLDDGLEDDDIALMVALVLHQTLGDGTHDEVTEAARLDEHALDLASGFVVEHWRLVERVAVELLKRSTLTGDELAEIANGPELSGNLAPMIRSSKRTWHLLDPARRGVVSLCGTAVGVHTATGTRPIVYADPATVRMCSLCWPNGGRS